MCNAQKKRDGDGNLNGRERNLLFENESKLEGMEQYARRDCPVFFGLVEERENKPGTAQIGAISKAQKNPKTTFSTTGDNKSSQKTFFSTILSTSILCYSFPRRTVFKV